MLKKIQKACPWLLFGLIMYWIFAIAVMQLPIEGSILESVILFLLLITFVIALAVLVGSFIIQIVLEIRHKGLKKALLQFGKDLLQAIIIVCVVKAVFIFSDREAMDRALLKDIIIWICGLFFCHYAMRFIWNLTEKK